jgi:hypothetical protein
LAGTPTAAGLEFVALGAGLIAATIAGIAIPVAAIAIPAFAGAILLILVLFRHGFVFVAGLGNGGTTFGQARKTRLENIARPFPGGPGGAKEKLVVRFPENWR